MTYEWRTMSYPPTMDQLSKEEVAVLVKEGRMAKGYTQQELADLTRISLRSVQRIENGEVLPRSYTLRMLAENLDFSVTPPIRESVSPVAPVGGTEPVTSPLTEPVTVEPRHFHPRTAGLSKARKLILTFSSGILLLLLTGAFLAQSARFPETDFERLLLWSAVVGIYSIALLRIWK